MQLELKRSSPKEGWTAISKSTGYAYGPWTTHRIAKGSIDMLRSWADTHLTGTVDELRELQQSLWKEQRDIETESRASEVVSMLIDERISDAYAAIEAEASTRMVVPLMIAKSAEELRYTFGPLMVPHESDKHGHTVDSATLQKSVWDWVETGDRVIHVNHSTEVAGNWVELSTWPVAHTMDMHKADGTVEPTEFPAGTPWIGVRWEPWAYADVKAGKINGMSLAGKARIVQL